MDAPPVIMDYSKLSPSERVTQANLLRLRGNDMYKCGMYKDAVRMYIHAIIILDDHGEAHNEAADVLQQLVDMRIKCHSNMAAALMQRGLYLAVKSCDVVLATQRDNVKATFRKGQCLVALGDTETAKNVLRAAQALDPENKLIQTEISSLKAKMEASERKSREMYRRMIGQEAVPKQEAAPKQEAVPEPAPKKVPTWVWAAGVAGAAAVVALGVASFRYLRG